MNFSAIFYACGVIIFICAEMTTTNVLALFGCAMCGIFMDILYALKDIKKEIKKYGKKD